MGDTIFDVSHPPELPSEGLSEANLQLITEELALTGFAVVY